MPEFEWEEIERNDTPSLEVDRVLAARSRDLMRACAFIADRAARKGATHEMTYRALLEALRQDAEITAQEEVDRSRYPGRKRRRTHREVSDRTWRRRVARFRGFGDFTLGCLAGVALTLAACGGLR